MDLFWLLFAVISLIVVIFAIFCAASDYVAVGHVGVLLRSGRVQPVALHEGFHRINPLYDRIIQMNTRTQKYWAKYDVASKDLQSIYVQMALNYRLLPIKAVEMYQNIGLNYFNVIISPAAEETLKANIALHTATEMIQERLKIKANIQKDLTVRLAKYGVELKEVSLTNISFDKGYAQAIEVKQIEEQRAEQKRYELIQAQRQAEIVTAQAKGDAEAIKILGLAEAESNQKVAASLTPTLIQMLINKYYLEKWDGKLPQFSMGNSTGLPLQLPIPNDLTEKK